jgi:hypothetical protein
MIKDDKKMRAAPNIHNRSRTIAVQDIVFVFLDGDD